MVPRFPVPRFQSPRSGWFAHNSGHPSAAGRAKDRESSPARDRLCQWGFTKAQIFPRYESAKKLLGLRKRNRDRYRDPQQRFTKPQS